MNVYLFELKQEYKRALVWSLILLTALFLLMVLSFPVYQNSRAEVEKVLEGFPPQFAALFGLNTADIFSYGGFYSFAFHYLSLCGAIMAAGLGLAAFAREKRARCEDFLLTKPLSRTGLFGAKLLAILSLLALSNLLYIGLAFILYRSSAQATAEDSRALLAASALGLSQLVILALAIFTAVFAKKIRSVSAGAMALAFGAFVLGALESLQKKEALRYIAPYRYFDVTAAFTQGRFETPYALTGLALIVLLLAAAFIRYSRADIHAV